MSNNAAVSDDGGEIGRAQWLQARACRVPTSVHMNPVLLKPQSEYGSQIIVHGQVWGYAKGRDYQRLKPQLLNYVLESYDCLSKDTDLVIVEGAGSPAEINLRAGDIANMGFATRADVPVMLVGDIDRGGVIASLVGTHAILSPEDRDMIEGYIINKFRGDVSLFADGIEAVNRFTGWHCMGVIPWLLPAGRLPAEDSVALERQAANNGTVKIAVPVLPRISNFDDLDPLAQEPGVDLQFIRAGDSFPKDAALIILPGSKSTIADLLELKKNGWDEDIKAHVRRGGKLIGICGGYQMLGRVLCDPLGLEGEPSEIDGLGLLDVETEMAPVKTLSNNTALSVEYSVPLDGYQIHLGVTQGVDCARPSTIIDGLPDGARSADGRVVGTYLHGLFGADAYRRKLLEEFGLVGGGFDYRSAVDDALDEIASALQQYLDNAWLDDLFTKA